MSFFGPDPEEEQDPILEGMPPAVREIADQLLQRLQAGLREPDYAQTCVRKTEAHWCDTHKSVWPEGMGIAQEACPVTMVLMAVSMWASERSVENAGYILSALGLWSISNFRKEEGE